MIARIRKALEEKEEGFTLIELLVVIIIIGILAAIAIPVFLSQRKKGYQASVKSDLNTVANEMETNFTDTQTYAVGFGSGTTAPTSYSASATFGTASAGSVLSGWVGTDKVTLSPGNTVTLVAANGNGYCLQGVSASDTAHPFFYDSGNGGLLKSGTTACIGNYS